MEYLIILSVFLAVAFFLHWKFKLVLYKSINSAVINILLVFLASLAWDLYATKRMHWIFPGDGLLGIYILWLPIEELLFYLLLQYFVIVIYRFVDDKLIK